MPALTPLFFYDEQIRRFLLQFARIFSNFQVEYGRDEEGTNHTLVRVPVRYGDATRQVQTILQENSASGMPSTPLMTFYINDLKYDRSRIQDPTFVSTMQVRQRTYDSNTDTYETTQGNAFTIDRLMPVPFELTLKLDIWTSNTNQKMQLLEQMLVLFNPSLELQSTDNYIDWTSLTVVELADINWSSRTIPVGTENPIDICTLTFKLPMWISSPAKVKKLGVVERIVANIYDANGDAANAITNNDLLLGTRQVFTPFGYQVLLIGGSPGNVGRLQVLQPAQVVDQPNASLVAPDAPASNLLWTAVVGMYGALRPGISYIRLEQENDVDVVGVVAFDPTDDRFLLWTVDEDTVPASTLPPINAVVNPLASGPGSGLPATAGQRYLFTEDTGTWDTGSAEAWQGLSGEPLVALANDIVEYNGQRWAVVFMRDSSPNNIQYVTNLTSNLQYKWTGKTWVKSYQGLYPGGKWSLVL
jgi:T4-like virus Myoviridae tail sheath stabiliser